MREIKFRALDKKNKKMRKVNSISFGYISPWKDGYPVVNCVGKDIINDKDILMQRECKECVLMQYTGLKDKNGKEIYEGDILDKSLMNRRKVKYDETLCAFISVDIRTRLEKRFINDANNYIVIGNIYENPELLQEVSQ